jgi:hypothetical protein
MSPDLGRMQASIAGAVRGFRFFAFFMGTTTARFPCGARGFRLGSALTQLSMWGTEHGAGNGEVV